MKKFPSILAFALAFALCWGSLSAVAGPRSKGSAAAPARVHFSGNLEGELEPCG